jgi:hypothetical protein
MITIGRGHAVPVRPVWEQTQWTLPRAAVEGVSAMPEAAVKSRPRLTLNSDGEPHRVENALTIFTFVAGLVAFAIGFVVSLHAIGTALGLVVFVVGLYAQMVSNTREQRVLIMAGIIASFVGLGLSIAHGGFG